MPIKLHEQYKKVFLCEKQNIQTQLQTIYDEPYSIRKMTAQLGGTTSKNCDIEVYPKRYFCNFSNDLLKWVKLFDVAKGNENLKTSDYSLVNYHVYTLKSLDPIAKMYKLPVGVTLFEIRNSDS